MSAGADGFMGAGAGGPVRAGADGLAGYLPWTVRRARQFLVGLHVALAVVSPAFTITGFQGDPGNPMLVVLASLAVGALQLRHSFAAARGERPRGWPWTLLALTLLVYLPMLWFTWDWAVMQYFVVASAAMLLRGRTAAVATAAPLLGTAAAGVREGLVTGAGADETAFLILFWLVSLAAAGVALYGSVRLVLVAEELHAARAELAELAVGRERLRVSRDLHDLLGQSLSAISLKGDLAIRLLRSDVSAARAEIEGLTGVARDALHGIHAVTRGERAASLRAETDGAAALLAAAGVDARITLDLPALPRPAEDVLAWAVREGVTNMLRHAEPSACSVTATRQEGTVRLEIVNDGAHPPVATGAPSRPAAHGPGASPPAAAGSGLAGLAERARALSGTVSAEHTRDGRFRLLVEIPEEVA